MTIAVNEDPASSCGTVGQAMPREADINADTVLTCPDSKALEDVDDAGKFATEGIIAKEETDFQSNVDDIIQPRSNISSSKKSVAFASTKWVREFDVDASTNYPEEEMDVDFGGVSKLRARKVPKLTNNRIHAQRTSVSNLLGLSDAAAIKFKHEPETKSIFVDEPVQSTFDDRTSQKTPIEVALLHSHSHTQIIHKAMQYIHRDRDVLLESLLKWCGIFHGASKGGALSSFLSIVPPKMGTRALLEEYHDCDYLDMLQFPLQLNEQHKNCGDDCNIDNENDLQKKLTRYGLEGDCPLPTTKQSHTLLWNYCLAVTGASRDAASLLVNQEADVSIHWGGGRHHAHKNRAGGFCYVNDIVLAIRTLLNGTNPSNGTKLVRRVLYIDLDIHHPDGVQSAFHDNDEVLTTSFHRHAAGFFPGSSGSIGEKGQSGSRGLGYNLNLPLPAGIGDTAFLYMYQKLLFGLVNVYEPHVIVLCVGADGLAEDALVNGGTSDTMFGTGDSDSDDFSYYTRSESYDMSSTTSEGWSLSPEGLAECVRIAAALCAGGNEESIRAIGSGKNESGVRDGSIHATSANSNKHIDGTCHSAVKQDDAHGIPSPSANPDNEAKSTTNALMKQEETPCRISDAHGIPSSSANSDSEAKSTTNVSIKQEETPCQATSSTSIALKSKGKRRKLMILGGGGYSPSQVSRTWLLCTAAACEGARPGMFWHELPKDIPNHCYFPRYGPTFELVSDVKREEFSEFYSSSSRDQIDQVNAELSSDDRDMLKKGVKAIDLTCLYIERQRKKAKTASSNFSFESAPRLEDELWSNHVPRKSSSQTIRRGRRKKLKQSPSDA